MPGGEAGHDSPPSEVPRLVVLRAGDPAARMLPDLFASEPRIWTDLDGRVCAYGYSADGRHSMRIPGVGSFYFEEDRSEPVTVVSAGPSPDLLEDVYLRMVVPMVLQVRGREVLHASAVLGPSGVAVFCAESRTGKSTIAYALSQRGYPLWADDVVSLDVDEVITVLPLPFRVRLMPESASLLMGREHTEKQAFGEFHAAAAAPSPLAAILLLERGRGDVEIERINPPTVAFPALLSHAYTFTVEGETRKRETIQNYLRVAARVPLFDVRLPTGLSDLGTTLDGLETSLADVAAGSR